MFRVATPATAGCSKLACPDISLVGIDQMQYAQAHCSIVIPKYKAFQKGSQLYESRYMLLVGPISRFYHGFGELSTC